MLRLNVPETIAKVALRSNMYETPLGNLMHQAIANPDEIRLANGPHDRPGSRVVMAPPECWELFLDMAREWSRTMPGDSHARRLAARRAQTFVERVERQLLRLSNHPAYKGHAVVGRDTTVLPAVRAVGTERWYPTERLALAKERYALELEYAELVPETQKVRVRIFTAWRAQPPSSGRGGLPAAPPLSARSTPRR